MRAIGIVRKLDPLGRVVLPVETRRIFEINAGDSMAIFVDGEAIMLRKYAPSCTFCDSVSSLETIKGKRVCIVCKRDLSKTL